MRFVRKETGHSASNKLALAGTRLVSFDNRTLPLLTTLATTNVSIDYNIFVN